MEIIRQVIFDTIEIIENNLKEQVAVADIAKKSGYSLFHFIRLFKGVAGFSPKDYILKRKLTEAAREILATDNQLLEIALQYGFNDHETFTRAFKREYGFTPMDLRKNRYERNFSFLEKLDRKKIPVEKKRQGEPEMIQLDHIFLSGYVFFFKYEESAKIFGEFWNSFLKEVPGIENRIIPEKYYQLKFWPEEQELNGVFFMLAVEVSDISNISASVSGKIIYPSKYLRFIHRGFAHKVVDTYSYIYEEYLPKTSYKLVYPYDFEYYGKNYQGPYNTDSEIEIYIPIA